MDESHAMEVFFDIQRGLPRQGPGSDDETRRALSYCRELPARPSVLDVGCGPGMQTLVLAETLNAHVSAVDLHQEYLDELRIRAAKTGLSDRIKPQLADMSDLSYPPASFDLIWAEGSAYIMGVGNALRTWKRLLKPQGYIGLTELVWLIDDPPQEVKRFFDAEYSVMGNVDANLSIATDAGYRLLAHFTLPDSAWWDDYYTPLRRKLPGLRDKYCNDEAALGLVTMTETEIAMREKYRTAFGYEFIVMQVSA